MKLKEFKPVVVRIGKPTIHFNYKGAVTISKTAVENLKITPDKKITFLQDVERPKDWYFTISEGESEFEIRKGPGGNSLMFNSRSLQVEIITSLGLDTDSSYSFPIGEPTIVNGVVYYPIITSKITA